MSERPPAPLDVGCGFGGMVLHAARHHGVSAVGVTLSPARHALATERVKAGLDDSGGDEVPQDRRSEEPVGSLAGVEPVGCEELRVHPEDRRPPEDFDEDDAVSGGDRSPDRLMRPHARP